MNRPTFNVVIPFEGVTTVQMNSQMRDLLCVFFMEFDDIETELYALAEFLRDAGMWGRKTSQAVFSVDNFLGVTTVNMNSHMVRILTEFIDETDDVEVEIQALCKALVNPTKCYELRMKKRNHRDQEPRFAGVR